MSADYVIFQGARGGLTFDFVPSDNASYDYAQYRDDRSGADVFNIHENAYLYLEKIIASCFLDYGPYSHWGVSYVPADIWLAILDNFDALRFDLRTGMHPKTLIVKHVHYPSLFWQRGKFHRRALLDLLDGFERRMRDLLNRYPYVAIGGI